MTARLDRISLTVLLIATVFTALAHGAVEVWSLAIFEWMCVLLLFLIGLKIASEGHFSLNLPATFWPLLAVLLLGLLQCFTWTDETGLRRSLSFDVEATRTSVLQFFLLLVGFIAAATCLAQRERLEMWQRFTVCFGGALALFALIQHFGWDGRFFWLRPAVAADITSPFGPFVHHGHFAGYMELLLPIPLALIITRSVNGSARLVYITAAALMIVAVIFSLSRGGTLGLLTELIFLGLAGTQIKRRLTYRHSRKIHKKPTYDEDRFQLNFHAFMQSVLSRLGIFVIAGILIVTGLLWISTEPVLNRIVSKQSLQSQGSKFYETRGWIWRDTLTMIKANPIIGVGLGAYETAFSQYTRSDGSLTVNAAHNDYLQVLADGGVIAGLAVIWFFVVLFKQLRRGMQSHDPLRAGLALGCGAAISAMLAHSAFDFNLHLPAHALLFLILAAISAELGADVQLPVTEPVSIPELQRGALAGATRSLRGTTS